MAHFIAALIGRPQVIDRIGAAADFPLPTDLPFGWSILPLGSEQIDQLTAFAPGDFSEGFRHLSTGLEAALSKALGDMTVAYIETDYFGGTGSQAAAVLKNGGVAFRSATSVSREPAHRDDPNAALRIVGIDASPDLDEFDTVGLGAFRTLESLGLEEPDEEFPSSVSIGNWREVSRSVGEGRISIFLSAPENRVRYVIYRLESPEWNVAYESGLFHELADAIRDADVYVQDRNI